MLTEAAGFDSGLIEYLLSGDQNLPLVLSVRRFLDEMPGGFFIYQADGDERILFANKALIRIFGCGTPEEFQKLSGGTFRGMVHPEDLENVEKSIKEQISHSQYDLDYVEYRITRKDGEIRWIDDYGHFIHSPKAGNLFYVFAGDATEKRLRLQQEKEALLRENFRREQSLQKRIDTYSQQLNVTNQELLQRLELIEGLSIDYESIFYADLDSNRLHPYRVSSRVEAQFKEDHPVHNFTGFDEEYIKNWVIPEDQELLRRVTKPDYIRKMLSTSKSFHINYQIRGGSSAEYLQMRIVKTGRGARVSQIVIGYRSVDSEIRHEMEQKRLLEQALDQASSAISAKDAFLANMSHDIRTPMNAITGFTALAKKNVSNPEKTREYLGKIAASGDHLLRLLNDVLEFSRLDAGDVPVEETACSLTGLLEELYQSVLPAANAKEITFTLETSGLSHQDVFCDQGKLCQILRQILDNAVKYTKPGGKISLSAMEQPGSIKDYSTFRFTVSDTGIGISQDFLEHIFLPFERQENTTLSGIQGTGLGLTIANNIAKLLGGAIEISSTPGKGSCFTLTLGLCLQNPAENTSPDRAPAFPKRPDRPKILLVEDNELNTEIAVELLEDSGFLVDTAANGRIAVDKVARSKPGEYFLILMDIQMPVMDGHQAALAIRALPDPALSNILIIALSANAFAQDKRKSMLCGMNAHLAKPIDIPKLLELIDTIARQPAGSGVWMDR